MSFPLQSAPSETHAPASVETVKAASRPILGMIAGLASAVCWVLSIPPFEFAEAAYVAFLPLLLWLLGRPGWRWTAGLGLASGWLAWFAILVWLRHVTWFGTIALSGILAVLFAGWVLLARWALPVASQKSFAFRFLAMAGLAGVWIVIEWSRNWLLYGFPWAPMALSQWERPVVLQIAAWTGAYGVSFLLIFFNLAVTQTLWHRVTTKERKMWSGWFSPDLYAALAGLGLCMYVFFATLPKANDSEEWFTAGVVQPYIPPDLKWDTERERENLDILEQFSRFVAAMDCDLLLWPEAATPWPVVGNDDMRTRAEAFADEIELPILMGTLGYEPESKQWYNGAALVEPGKGLREPFYIKRELVPFGEYVPPPFHGIVEKFVPLDGSFVPGEGPQLIPVELGGRTFRVGALVCYEDVFPALARESVRAGAQVLFVTTNNAWYGEEGGAYQHAAHSVLRAVENRRPVMRCGNGGWSGWIDAYGTIRHVSRNEDRSIYFRGGDRLRISRFEPWTRRQSYYTRKGDWFVLVSAALGLAGMLAVAFSRKT